MTELKTEQTSGTGREASELDGLVNCRSCGYVGSIDTYEPVMSLYNDCRCPECGSTNNQHNEDYATRLSEAMQAS